MSSRNRTAPDRSGADGGARAIVAIVGPAAPGHAAHRHSRRQRRLPAPQGSRRLARLASLIVASFVLRRQRVDAAGARLVRQPALRALAPLALVVAVGALTTSHPAHFRAAFIDFAIGVACLVGWSLALDAPALRRLLVWTIPPADARGGAGVDQFSGWFGTLDWLQVRRRRRGCGSRRRSAIPATSPGCWCCRCSSASMRRGRSRRDGARCSPWRWSS